MDASQEDTAGGERDPALQWLQEVLGWPAQTDQGWVSALAELMMEGSEMMMGPVGEAALVELMTGESMFWTICLFSLLVLA